MDERRDSSKSGSIKQVRRLRPLVLLREGRAGWLIGFEPAGPKQQPFLDTISPYINRLIQKILLVINVYCGRVD